jgi:uncharacterized membrane protein
VSDMSEENGNGIKFERHSGPLPHPNILKGYHEISPMLGEIIVNEFVKEAEHRRALENKEQEDYSRALTAEIQAQTRGQHYGLLSMIALAAVGLTIALTVNPWGGVTVITSAAVGAAIIFVTGKAPIQNSAPVISKESNQPSLPSDSSTPPKV